MNTECPTIHRTVMCLWVLALLLQPVALHVASLQTDSTRARQDLQAATNAGPTQGNHLVAAAAQQSGRNTSSNGNASQSPASRHQHQQKQLHVTAVTTPDEVLAQQSLRVSCSADTFSKQSCLFNNVCFLPSSSGGSSRTDDGSDLSSLTVVLQGAAGSTTSTSTSSKAAASRTAALLKQHLDHILKGQFKSINYLTAATAPGISTSRSRTDHALAHTILHNSTDTVDGSHHTIKIEHAVTVLWRVHPGNQESFGHALINEAFPMFLVLSNHFGEASGDIPRNLQLLVSGEWHPVLQHVVSEMITHNSHLLAARLAALQQQGKAGVCFRHLLLGDGGYITTTRNSLANSGKQEAHIYSQTPSIFNSRNWWAFRTHALQVAGVVGQALGPSRRLILINDKRYHDSSSSDVNHSSSSGSSSSTTSRWWWLSSSSSSKTAAAQLQLKSDRRMILGVDQLAEQLRATYPTADLVAARFRDMQWPDQLRLMSAASVFITTQGSSAFRLVFLPAGATCIMVGAPEGPGHTDWRSFHELDRWFPLSYVTFERYNIDVNASSEYVVSVKPGHWQPEDAAAAKQRWLYNADVRLQLERLRPLIDRTLGGRLTGCEQHVCFGCSGPG